MLLLSIIIGIIIGSPISSVSVRRVPSCGIMDRRFMSAGRPCRGGRFERFACGIELMSGAATEAAAAAAAAAGLGSAGWLGP